MDIKDNNNNKGEINNETISFFGVKYFQNLQDVQAQVLEKSNIYYEESKVESLMIKIAYIFDEDQNCISEQKLKDAQESVRYVKVCNHPNVIKYKDEFILGKDYFIIKENYQKSLQFWVDENKNEYINNEQFLKFANQLFEGLQYLHSKGLFLDDINLSKILLDKDNNIKLTSFGNFKEKQILFDPYKYQNQSSSEKVFYYPPEILEEDKEDKMKVQRLKQKSSIQGDIWSICICLYIIAGAKVDHVAKVILGEESITTQFQVDHRINNILKRIIQRDPKLRPSIAEIIEQFKQFDQQKKQSIQDLSEEKRIFEEAQKLFDEDVYNESIELFQKIILMQPTNEIYLAWLGRALNSNNQRDESLYWTEQSLKFNSNNNELALYNLGNTYRIQEKFEESIQSYLKVLEINPENDAALNNLGLAYDQIEMYDKSIECYNKALQLKPDKQNTIYNLGISNFRQQQYSKAITHFQKVLDLNPKYEGALNYIGSIYYIENNYEEAKKYFQKSLELNPKDKDSLYNCGIIIYNQNQFNLSQIYFQKAKRQIKEVKEVDEDITFILGSNYYCRIIYEKSITYFQKTLDINPENTEAIQYLKISKQRI